MVCIHKLNYYTGVCESCGWIADTSPQSDLWWLYEHRDLLLEILSVPNLNEHEKYQEELEAVQKKIKHMHDLYNHQFPRKIIIPPFV